MFHLGWFAVEGVQGWGTDNYDASYRWNSPELHKTMARRLEEACLDFILIEDASAVPDQYGQSFEAYLKYAVGVPKFDPAVMATLMADATSRIGIIPTLTTTFYPPFLLARLVATMDHMTGGRIGWNVVTSSSELAAMNYGLEGLPEHDERYDVAEEYLDLCNQLWNSWDADAIVADPAAKIFADHAKVRKVNFQGPHYRCRGPLERSAVAPGPARHCPSGQFTPGHAVRGQACRHRPHARQSPGGNQSLSRRNPAPGGPGWARG